MVERRTVAILTYFAVGVLGATLIDCAPWLISLTTGHNLSMGGNGMVSTIAAVILGTTWGVYFAVRGFGQLDEFQRERATRQTFWGFIAGVAVSAPIYSFIMAGGIRFIYSAAPSGKPYAMAYAAGYATLFISLLVCQAAVSLYMQFLKR